MTLVQLKGVKATTIPVDLASYARRCWTETHAFVCFIVRKDIFTREKTAQDEGRIGNMNKHWTAENGMKIRFYCMKLPLKDGDGILRDIF